MMASQDSILKNVARLSQSINHQYEQLNKLLGLRASLNDDDSIYVQLLMLQLGLIRNISRSDEIYFSGIVSALINLGHTLGLNPTVKAISAAPPKPSMMTLIKDSTISNCKIYGEVNHVITSSLNSNTATQFLYLAIEGGGFAMFLPFEEINSTGQVVGSIKKSKLSYLFSYEHFETLFTTPKGYSRCLMIFVSPQINSFSQELITVDELKTWNEASYITLPKNIAIAKTPKELNVVALLYEFEKNENTKKIKQLFGKDCVTDLSELPLIKALNK